MHVYDQFKLRHLRNLEIDVSALYVIAAPSTPEPRVASPPFAPGSPWLSRSRRAA
jgi:hypothetical protein